MKHLKVMIHNNFVRNDAGNVVEAGFIYPAEWDASKIRVRAYKALEGGGAEFCVVETDDDLAVSLLTNVEVTELQKAEADDLVVQARGPEVAVVIIMRITDSKLEEKLVKVLEESNVVFKVERG